MRCERCGHPVREARPTRPITKRQHEVLDHLRWHIAEYGYSPSFEEIRTYFSYRSLATVAEHIESLEAAGRITRDFRRARSITVVEDAA